MIDREGQRFITAAKLHQVAINGHVRNLERAGAQRSHAIRMAVANGATHAEIARELGISRVRVTMLVNGT